jgi:hypothetical protein
VDEVALIRDTISHYAPALIAQNSSRHRLSFASLALADIPAALPISDAPINAAPVFASARWSYRRATAMLVHFRETPYGLAMSLVETRPRRACRELGLDRDSAFQFQFAAELR